MEINLKKMQQQQFDNLFVILNSQKLCMNQIQKSNFQEIIEKQINILYFLETKNKSKHDQSKKIVERYNLLTSKGFQVNKQTKYTDNDNLIDDINYLSVYFKNLANIDINEFSKQYKPEIEKLNNSSNVDINETKNNKEKINLDQQKVIDSNKKQESNNSQNQQQGFNNNQQNPWGNFQNQGPIPGAVGNNPFSGMNQNINPYQNPYFIGQAQSRIALEIKEGKIFAYKSKNKIIPITKFLTSFLILLLALSSLVLGVMYALVDGFQVSDWKWGTQDFVFNGIANAIMYIFFSIIFTFVAYWMIKPMISIKFKKGTQKKPVNQNELYYFAWQLTVIFAIFFILALIMGMFITHDNTSDTIFNLPSFVKKVTTNSKVVGLWGWYYTYIIMFVVSGLIIFPIIIASIYNPKKDLEKINLIVKQYIDEMSSQQKPF